MGVMEALLVVFLLNPRGRKVVLVKRGGGGRMEINFSISVSPEATGHMAEGFEERQGEKGLNFETLKRAAEESWYKTEAERPPPFSSLISST